MDYAKFVCRSPRKGNCDSCIKIHNKRELTVPCDNCPQGFKEPFPENYETIGLVEKYGLATFITVTGETTNVDTTGIRNVLDIEGYDPQEYRDQFNNLTIYVSSIITAINSNKRDN